MHAGALVEDCVILDNCDIGRRAKLRRAILDKNVRIPEDAVIGYDLERDRRHHHVTETGIVVVGGPRTPVGVTELVVDAPGERLSAVKNNHANRSSRSRLRCRFRAATVRER